MDLRRRPTGTNEMRTLVATTRAFTPILVELKLTRQVGTLLRRLEVGVQWADNSSESGRATTAQRTHEVKFGLTALTFPPRAAYTEGMAAVRVPRCPVHGIPMNLIGPGRRTVVCPARAGSIRTARKAEASRRNIRLGQMPMTGRLCRLCKKSRLAITNRSGICRNCQRHRHISKALIRLSA